ncbi:MAG: tyrosine-type recombinase/integrase [Candidatus Paceibacteria bacterium]
MSDYEYIHNKIEEQKDQLPAEWMTTNFKAEAKRQGAQARGTQANYLKALRKILIEEEIGWERLEEIRSMQADELKELNKDIADNIQNSKYRRKKGEDGVRRKRQYWKSWKTLLETQGHSTEAWKEYMPKIEWNQPKEKDDSTTDPSQIPTRDQMKQFVKNLGEKSRGHVALRNQALALLLWDKGPRIGEALAIKLKHVDVTGKQMTIKIPGNKGSDTRTVPIYQGRKTLKDWYQSHPYRGNPEAYFFPVLQKEKPETQMQSNTSLDDKFHSCARNLDFKTRNEPFHIFRKGMTTAHRINEWATWEDICEWHGKKNDATKPDYLLMMIEDVNVSVGENMGIDPEAIPEKSENSMQGKPLKPLKCRSCSQLNKCFLEICSSCGDELPEAELPDNLNQKEEKADVFSREESNDKVEKLKERLDELEEKV